MAGPENVAFEELCRNANKHLKEALDYMQAHPLSPPTPEQERMLAYAKKCVYGARRALDWCSR